MSYGITPQDALYLAGDYLGIPRSQLTAQYVSPVSRGTYAECYEMEDIDLDTTETITVEQYFVSCEEGLREAWNIRIMTSDIHTEINVDRMTGLHTVVE
ncbi:hypothetical protein IWQ62_002013 [Dispira parvispora]|uniref:Uncharacterized protein n=1 Tax=Dispira parvispora TaxID=1520584 RepID=A0A9W8AS99_9FUNG|nr:hypothetical protein IWQ62_002013 [Dispira parvispora]